jgi:hypothetical protein
VWPQKLRAGRNNSRDVHRSMTSWRKGGAGSSSSTIPSGTSALSRSQKAKDGIYSRFSGESRGHGGCPACKNVLGWRLSRGRVPGPLVVTGLSPPRSRVTRGKRHPKAIDMKSAPRPPTGVLDMSGVCGSSVSRLERRGRADRRNVSPGKISTRDPSRRTSYRQRYIYIIETDRRRPFQKIESSAVAVSHP